MLRVHVICEGPTEEKFVNELLVPRLISRDIDLRPSVVGQPGKKGGDVSYERLCADVKKRLLDDRQCHCTTLFDFYGLKSDFPGRSRAVNYTNPRDRFNTICSHLNAALENDVGENSIRRFVPYVQMHEFEGLLFSDPMGFALAIEKPSLVAPFTKIRNKFQTPEHINDGPHTAPSKRVISLFPPDTRYEKPTLGALAASGIGVEVIRQECRLFDNWLTTLANLPSPPA